MENVLVNELTTFRDAFLNKVNNAKNIAISGHIRPDGDCIGACLGLYQYLQKNMNTDGQKEITVYLDPISDAFLFLKGASEIKTEREINKVYDLFIALDCGSIDRLGTSQQVFDQAKETISIDHHVSNLGYANLNYIEADASSTCEVLCGILDHKCIDLDTASALYTGIVHDTGVFKHSNTSRKSMEMAGVLLEKGVNSSQIIDESFYQKTYVQNQILGRCLLESMLVLNGKVIVSIVTRKQMEFYQAQTYDLEGIIDQLRVTKGVEVALFIHELSDGEYKVSMRSNGDVNVSKIATFFGGGGHIKAAGCTMKGSSYDVINNLTLHIETQLKELGVI